MTLYQIQQGMQEIRACNEFSGRYGLMLNEGEIRELAECRQKALKDTDRIEFGGGILPKLIRAFCDSPYLDRENYASTLVELQEAFYYFKSEAQEAFSDDELIEFMVTVFNERAQGSVDYLTTVSLEELCRDAREGRDDPFKPDEVGDLF